MWGTRIIDAEQANAARFIPTHVGNSRHLRGQLPDQPVHPHACGELSAGVIPDYPIYGSSPRMWGTLPRSFHGHARKRFIPTHVGNSRYSISIWFPIAVHPHACGELENVHAGMNYYTGSSPRMWGTPRNQYCFSEDSRFIPTHVGNSGRGRQPLAGLPVHPHACGELKQNTMFCPRDTGSSPRMWGTLMAEHSYIGLVRFIPTHVGNSKPAFHRTGESPVHPHACGELLSMASSAASASGSSPRMWGTQPDNGADNTVSRFIPTHVGNSGAARSPYPQGSVHPHACGELRGRQSSLLFRNGSSPRMWGTRGGPPRYRDRYRFIPTHVGNSATN